MSKSTFENIQWYQQLFETLEGQLNGAAEQPVHQIRRKALDALNEKGFPTRKDEEWKYTSIRPLLKHQLVAAPEAEASMSELAQLTVPELEANLLIVVNGRYREDLSILSDVPDNVTICGLQHALTQHPDLVGDKWAMTARAEENSFTALNTAFTYDGLFIHVPTGQVCETPLHIVSLTVPGDEAHVAHPRLLVVCEDASQLKLVESHGTTTTGAVYFNNQVTEIHVGQNANMDHIKLQQESNSAFHISSLHASQEANSTYSILNVDMGGSLVRNNTNIRLDGEHCESHLIGLYLATDKQHVDNHTFIDHAMPNCESNEIYKGILGGQARGVFNGKVFVRRDAQKTNAYQSNKALLLTEEAHVNSKPELEIYADDVKCSHGATVGQLDDEALFYLQSRGISEQNARAMMQFAFAADVFQHVNIAEVSTYLDEIVQAKFDEL